MTGKDAIECGHMFDCNLLLIPQVSQDYKFAKLSGFSKFFMCDLPGSSTVIGDSLIAGYSAGIGHHEAKPFAGAPVQQRFTVHRR